MQGRGLNIQLSYHRALKGPGLDRMLESRILCQKGQHQAAGCCGDPPEHVCAMAYEQTKHQHRVKASLEPYEHLKFTLHQQMGLVCRPYDHSTYSQTSHTF